MKQKRKQLKIDNKKYLPDFFRRRLQKLFEKQSEMIRKLKGMSQNIIIYTKKSAWRIKLLNWYTTLYF